MTRLAPAPSPIERLIDASGLRCTVCGAPKGACQCWVECRCGRAYLRGEACGNPIHEREREAQTVAEAVAASVISEVRSVYPEPMKHASGGFRRTLQQTIIREVKAVVLAAISPEEPA
jgi:hypothetical protein